MFVDTVNLRALFIIELSSPSALARYRLSSHDCADNASLPSLNNKYLPQNRCLGADLEAVSLGGQYERSHRR